jgi:hypothetical protein
MASRFRASRSASSSSGRPQPTVVMTIRLLPPGERLAARPLEAQPPLPPPRPRRRWHCSAFPAFHDLRLTALTLEAAAGNPAVYLQLKAGHSQAAITERYIHAAQVPQPTRAAATAATPRIPPDLASIFSGPSPRSRSGQAQAHGMTLWGPCGEPTAPGCMTTMTGTAASRAS